MATKTLADLIFDAMYLAVGDMKSERGQVIGYPGPQPPREFAEQIAKHLAQVIEWKRVTG